MVWAFLVLQQASGVQILQDTWNKVSHAKTLSVSVTLGSEEFKGRSTTRYWFRGGGYFRADNGSVVDVSNPKRAWTFSADKRTYQVRLPLAADFQMAQSVSFEMFKPGLSIIGAPKTVVWHMRPAVRIELDGRKVMTKETKLFVFVDPKSHLPVGVSANLGSLTQTMIYGDLKIGEAIEDAVFIFVPPTSWKLVTPQTGGWQ